MIIGLFPPLFSEISKDLNVEVSLLGFISGANILFMVLASVLWGYFSGKYNRKRLIIFGTIIWAISVYITSKSQSYKMLLIMQIITGIGLGCISSVGFSILTDYIPNKFRGLLLSFWGMSQGLGGVLGALFASIIAPKGSWRTPFEVLSIIGLIMIVLYIFTKEPSYGESEPQINNLIKPGGKYKHSIKIKNLHDIITNKSNKYLFLQAFFANITIGTLIWLPTLYNSKLREIGYGSEISIIISGYIYAIFQIGGALSPIFGYLSDFLKRKYEISRAKITSYFIFLMVPFYLIMFISPMKNLELGVSDSSIVLLYNFLKQVFLNPWMFLIFLFAILASACQSANTPNWLAIITEVNLPENRSSAFSMANLANGIGRSIGTSGIGIIIGILSKNFIPPDNYIYSLAIFQMFLIPSGIFYLIMSKHNLSDASTVISVLDKRVRKEINSKILK
jgi:MFS family permease